MTNAIGLDTSIVVRLLCGEPAELTEKATRLLEESYHNNIDCLVSDYVVIEAYFVLIHHYEVPKKEAVKQLIKFLRSGMVRSIGKALDILLSFNEKGPEIVDRFIRLDYLKTTNTIYTFDKIFSRMDHVDLLK